MIWRKAKVTASSESKLDFGKEDCEHFELLNYPLAQIFPLLIIEWIQCLYT